MQKVEERKAGRRALQGLWDCLLSKGDDAGPFCKFPGIMQIFCGTTSLIDIKLQTNKLSIKKTKALRMLSCKSDNIKIRNVVFLVCS
jgi:hypothetical protein